MNKPNMRTRAYSFAVPALMDGLLGFAQTALPLLAIRFGATPWFLGMLGWTAQTARLPFTISSGTISDRIGRTRIIIPAAAAAALACIGFMLAQNKLQLLLLYVALMSSVGAFYPTLQAFIGDHSPQGQLRKNLSAFNVGWTVGGSVCALFAGYLLVVWKGLPFGLGALCGIGVILVVLMWNRVPVQSSAGTNDAPQPSEGPGRLLFISRIGHFLGFFGVAIVRLQFPKLGTELGMDEGIIGVLVGMVLVGQAVGIFLASASPWWRGKLWPQVTAQGVSMASGIMVFLAATPVLFAIAFLIQGASMGIAYTGALYYGLQARTNMGKNTGIHEMLVAGGHIIGSFSGGVAAQFVSLRAPYVFFALVCAVGSAVSLIYWRRSMRTTNSATSSANSPPA